MEVYSIGDAQQGRHFDTLGALVTHLHRSDGEDQQGQVVVVVVGQPTKVFPAKNNSTLEQLDAERLAQLLQWRFRHRPLIVVRDGQQFDQQSKDLALSVESRLQRMIAWVQEEHVPTYIAQDEEDMFTQFLIEEVPYMDLLNLGGHSEKYYTDKINRWGFNAYEFDHDELLYIAYLILSGCPYDQRLEGKKLLSLLFFVRDNYHTGNPFHNWRHAIDVLQATNYYIQQLINSSSEERFDIPTVDQYALLLASLGHDIGHPGITNAFLINQSTPLANLYDNISVLEQFHHTQFAQIIRPYLLGLPNKRHVEKVIHSSILATDMARHDSFVEQLESGPALANDTELLCSVLIKCADISNVCRPLDSSCKWGLSLGAEFTQISQLEKCLHGQSISEFCHSHNVQGFNIDQIGTQQAVDLVPTLCGSQLFFINRFAKDFFGKVGICLPPLNFLSKQLDENANFWQDQLS